MTATTSTRYDFGRCTVEHVAPRTEFGSPLQWGGASVATRSVVVRMKQAHGGDDALVTLLDFDARGLASKILELLDADQ